MSGWINADNSSAAAASAAVTAAAPTSAAAAEAPDGGCGRSGGKSSLNRVIGATRLRCCAAAAEDLLQLSRGLST